MGSFLDKPKTEKTTDCNKGNGLSYGVSAMQGWRIEMEDSHCSKIGLEQLGLEDWSFFAVFDGHAGGTVSKVSSKDLLKSILEADRDLFQEIANSKHLNADCTNNENTQLSQNSSSTSSLSTVSPANATSTNELTSTTATGNSNNTTEFDSSSNGNLESVASTTIPNDSTTSSSNDLNNQNITNVSPTKTKSASSSNGHPNIPDYQNRLKAAIRKGFLDFDEKLRQLPEFDRGEDKSGSTAVACLVSPTDVYLINCGDSRAIFVSDNKIALSTYDHKPINPSERERIQNAGGSVMIQRVNGSLAVSRALGDYEYKCVEGKGPCEQLVSPEPEIYHCPRHAKDEFVVLACDGIWDVMTNDDLREYINSRLKVTNDLVKISNEVLDMCLNKGSRDNMSIIIVTFPGAPKVMQEEVEKDNICNQKIERKIKELIDKSTTRLEFSQVLHTISEEKWDDLPPGGGLYAKQSLIEEIFNRLSPRSNEADNINNNFLLNPPL